MYLPNEKYTHPGKTVTGGDIAGSPAVKDKNQLQPVANVGGSVSAAYSPGYGMGKQPYTPDNPYAKQKMGPGEKSPLMGAMSDQTYQQPMYQGGGNPLYGGRRPGEGANLWSGVNLGKLDYGPWSGEGNYFNPYTGEKLGYGKANRFGGTSAFDLLQGLGGQPSQPASPARNPQSGGDFMSQWRAAGSPKTFSGDLMEALNAARSGGR